MACERIGDAIVCSRRRAAAQCGEQNCRNSQVALCDYPVEGGKRTCDRSMCATHRHPVGKNRDFCPEHFALRMNELRAAK